MALDRWIAMIILLICLAYGYAAYFTMDEALAPFMRRNPIWPSTFPKILSVLAIICSLLILVGFEKSSGDPKPSEINYRRLTDYKLGQAIMLLILMVAYALLLRPAGFLASTAGFLFIGFYILGERRYLSMALSAAIAAGVVWYLVDHVLGIFLSPLPFFLSNGG
jgi:putative tricarboxylic transport membrane protein